MSYILHSSFFLLLHFVFMFIIPRGVEPWAPSLCSWHPTRFILHTTVFSFSSIVPLPSACLSPPLQSPTSGSHPAAVPNPQPCPASRPPPLAALPRRSPCPTRNPILHAPPSSTRRQLADFLVHPARFYNTRVARAHPWATWPPLSPPFVHHPILAVIAIFNSVTRHFQLQAFSTIFPSCDRPLFPIQRRSILFNITLI